MKLSIMSGAYTLNSELTVEDIVLLKKYNPDALTIKDEDGNVKFAVGYSEGKPSIAPFGVTFGMKSFNDGKASITETLPTTLDTAEKAKEYVAEKFGGVVAYLETLESTIPEAAKVIKDKRKALIDSITVA